MSTGQPALEVVQAYYDALQRGNLEGLLAVAADDIVLEEASSLPYAGVYRGHTGWQDFVTAVWQDPVITVDSIADAGNYVVDLARLSAKSRRTGQSIEMPFLYALLWLILPSGVSAVRFTKNHRYRLLGTGTFIKLIKRFFIDLYNQNIPPIP